MPPLDLADLGNAVSDASQAIDNVALSLIVAGRPEELGAEYDAARSALDMCANALFVLSEKIDAQFDKPTKE